jgi:hypothetical protein
MVRGALHGPRRPLHRSGLSVHLARSVLAARGAAAPRHRPPVPPDESADAQRAQSAERAIPTIPRTLDRAVADRHRGLAPPWPGRLQGVAHIVRFDDLRQLALSHPRGVPDSSRASAPGPQPAGAAGARRGHRRVRRAAAAKPPGGHGSGRHRRRDASRPPRWCRLLWACAECRPQHRRVTRALRCIRTPGRLPRLFRAETNSYPPVFARSSLDICKMPEKGEEE